MKRTGQSRIAVVGWGRGMGHKGHMYLADAVIEQAKKMNADPYFFVSKTIGKDDPIFPEEKVEIYQRVFPQQAIIFTAQNNLNDSLKQLAELGYQGVVVVVGCVTTVPVVPVDVVGVVVGVVLVCVTGEPTPSVPL